MIKYWLLSSEVNPYNKVILKLPEMIRFIKIVRVLSRKFSPPSHNVVNTGETESYLPLFLYVQVQSSPAVAQLIPVPLREFLYPLPGWGGGLGAG